MEWTKALPEALGAHVCGQRVDWDEPCPIEDWLSLLNAAAEHRILPMVYETVRLCPSFQAVSDDAELIPYKQDVKRQVVAQTVRTTELIALLQSLATADILPVLAKGVVCREIYPLPDARTSGDEDLYISPTQLLSCDEALRAYGMVSVGRTPTLIRDSADFSYLKRDGSFYMELHTALFPPDAKDCGDLNALFEGWESRTVSRIVAGVPMRVMGHTDHLLYLILHAFKHFLHGGVGLRQLCDIALYANAYGADADWTHIQTACRTARADGFATAALEIGRRYFGLQDEKAGIPSDWHSCIVSPEDLLTDTLMGGIYGGRSPERKNNGIFTVQAICAQREGRRRSSFSAIWKVVFLPRRNMVTFYPYLYRFPFLLPVAWIQRIIDRAGKPGSLAGLRACHMCGVERIELLKKYGAL